MFRKIGVGVAVGILLAVLTGCGATGTPEEQYVSEVRHDVAGLKDAEDRDIIYVGTAMCESLDDGVPEKMLVAVGSDHGFTKRETQTIIDAAKRHIC
jgi:hypothetical protein